MIEGRGEVVESGERGSLWAVALAGGEGTRLRPLVRHVCGDERPKQFSPLLGARTLLGQTLDRVGRLLTPERTVVVTRQAHARYMERELGTTPHPDVLSQPESRERPPTPPGRAVDRGAGSGRDARVLSIGSSRSGRGRLHGARGGVGLICEARAPADRAPWGAAESAEACPQMLAVSELPGLTWCDLGSPERVVKMLTRLGVSAHWMATYTA